MVQPLMSNTRLPKSSSHTEPQEVWVWTPKEAFSKGVWGSKNRSSQGIWKTGKYILYIHKYIYIYLCCSMILRCHSGWKISADPFLVRLEVASRQVGHLNSTGAWVGVSCPPPESHMQKDESSRHTAVKIFELALRIQVCPKKGITPTILLWESD